MTETTKHLLTEEQREAGLDTYEDDHNVFIIDTSTNTMAAVFGYLTTVQTIQSAANDYLIERARRQ